MAWSYYHYHLFWISLVGCNHFLVSWYNFKVTRWKANQPKEVALHQAARSYFHPHVALTLDLLHLSCAIKGITAIRACKVWLKVGQFTGSDFWDLLWPRVTLILVDRFMPMPGGRLVPNCIRTLCFQNIVFTFTSLVTDEQIENMIAEVWDKHPETVPRRMSAAWGKHCILFMRDYTAWRTCLHVFFHSEME